MERIDVGALNRDGQLVTRRCSLDGGQTWMSYVQSNSASAHQAVMRVIRHARRPECRR
ncbi:hypothetical protein ACQEVZ_27970 [Dactylosporangium sp. CA-152071]|uniref:hypothetical protein n=1 Tax=Dactylosporangium sp. CA-152071 TaxID=3239933 RepID=UPI003D8CD872